MVRRVAALASAFFLTSCGGLSTTAVPPPGGSGAVAAGAPAAPDAAMPAQSFGKIRHVVIIMQENRSFDYLFHAFPGANTVDFGVGHGKKYPLVVRGLADPTDIEHSHVQFLIDYDRGKNDGWNDSFESFKAGCRDPQNHPACWQYYPDQLHQEVAFSYAPRREVRPYWTLARQYALADNAFASNNGPSYVAHQDMIAGQAHHVVENPFKSPWGCDGPPDNYTFILKYGTTRPPVFSPATGIEHPSVAPCFNYKTAADLLDNAGVSWAYYAPDVQSYGGIWSAFDAIWSVRFGSDWVADVKSPETKIFNDIQAGTLPQVSWVVPSFVNSDHAGSRSRTGPMWVATLVNAIGESPYWKDTAIVLMWDEWGGWYDHVKPAQLRDPQTGAYEGLGYRIPLLVISPYAKHGFVSHKRHEVASSLHFIEAAFGLPSLQADDARADDLRDMFDFTQQPAPFRPIPDDRRPSEFLKQKPSLEPPDD
ncbi:MAG TPA: alkaline phosphatase family protein [Candidatus Tumulicola sp.]|nr:alkaline phosphatase family protein [Candidatus Tumulicola sp.]